MGAGRVGVERVLSPRIFFFFFYALINRRERWAGTSRRYAWNGHRDCNSLLS